MSYVATTRIKHGKGRYLEAGDELPESFTEDQVKSLVALGSAKKGEGRRRAAAPVVPASEEVGESSGAQATSPKVPVKQEAPKGTGGQVSKSTSTSTKKD